MTPEILYDDGYLIAINKPHGLLVHRSGIAAEVKDFALQSVRDHTGRWVYPVHRLDRKTGGVLLFAYEGKSVKKLKEEFEEGRVTKKYLAIVRGYTADYGEITYPLKKENGTFQEAVTHYRTLSRNELLIAYGKHSTSRYSLVEAVPQTGRMHQIRKHFAHIFHPIIGDRPHGCNKQNRLFREKWNMTTMLLHASELSFRHPQTEEPLRITAPLQSGFSEMLIILGLKA